MSAERTWDDLIEENDREYGTAWIPDGDNGSPTTLVGTVTGWEFVTTDNMPQGAWVVAVTDRAGGRWSVWLSRKVLREEFSKYMPKPGERIVLRYRGQAEKASRTGYTPAHLYTLTVEGRRQEVEMPSAAQLTTGEDTRRDVEVTGESDVPTDPDEFTYGRPRPRAAEADVEIPDADVIPDPPKGDDDDIPF